MTTGLEKTEEVLQIILTRKNPAFQIEVPVLDDYDEIWVFAKTKSLPSHYNGIPICVFIIHQDKMSVLKKLSGKN